MIEKIIKFLLDYHDFKTWEEFVDNQELGNCQFIVYLISNEFNVKRVFGEIEVDESYIDEDGEEQILMVHHWVEINGEIWDFSKGSLSNFIGWIDKYSVDVTGDEWRYK